MKVYVIKNNDGMYFDGNFCNNLHWDDTIRYAWFFSDKETAEHDCCNQDIFDDDCKVEEITIAEGDLEQENKILQKALELAVHDLATYEWQGLGKFARSEEIIQAELIDQAKKEMEE